MAVFDPFTVRPRTVCEGCRGALVHDDAAFAVLAAAHDASTVTTLALLTAGGGALYACPRCRTGGAFSPLLSGGKSC